MRIRRRHPQRDDRFIHRIIREELVPFSQYPVSGGELTLRATTERLDRSTTYVVVNKAGQVSGFVNFFEKDHQLVIDMIALNRHTQGLGWGGRLLRAAEQAGRRLGCVQCMLALDDGNDRAYRFYEKNGYQVTDYMTHIRCYRLTKQL